MIYKKILTFFYLKFSKLYVFLFGRKKMQFINDIIFSLSLDAKGYKHYGHFFNSGEKSFIKLIKNEINLSLDREQILEITQNYCSQKLNQT
jgi:hypothetical protein